MTLKELNFTNILIFISKNVIYSQLETETKSRETIGTELEKRAKECDEFDSLIQRAHHVISNIESVIALMENTK